MFMEKWPVNYLPDIPGVQRDGPRFPFSRATEVERLAIIKCSTARSNLASSYLVPEWAELPLKPIEHLTVIRDNRHTGSLCSFQEKKYRGDRFCQNHETLEGTLVYGQRKFCHRCWGKETTSKFKPQPSAWNTVITAIIKIVFCFYYFKILNTNTEGTT